ncbi:MAG: hypothetical protein K6F51_08390 [Acetatifactor sp.]|nr:hypothetical protein [Acetatifactor sp.]
MKKTVIFMCILTLMVTLCGCDGLSDKKEDAEGTVETSSEIAEATAEPAKMPDATPEATPTPEASPEVTPTPEATPTPELSKDPIEYGDLTEYLYKPASEAITAFDRPYRYDYWGPGHETGAEGGFTFDDKVYFGFQNSDRNLEPSNDVRSFIIYNDGAKKLDAGIGKGLNAKMKYSEIKSVFGDNLHGPVANEDGTQYSAYGEYYYVIYYFTWKKSPIQNDVPADVVMVYDYFPGSHVDPEAYVLRKPVKKYLDENKKLLFTEHREQLRGELREAYQNEPVFKYNLLTAIQADEHNVVEVYEMAYYGCPPTYEKKILDPQGSGYEINGIDKSKELYGYTIKLRLLSDGQVIDYYYLEDESEEGRAYDYSSDWVSGGFWWIKSDDVEENELRKMIGIPGKQKDCVVSSATTRRPVTEYGASFAEMITAYYLNDDKTPILIGYKEAYESNDGGLSIKSLKTADGKDLLNGRKLAKEGTGTICGHKVTWKLYDTSCGIPIVTTFTEEGEEWGGTWREYVLLDDCLIQFYSFYSL